MGQQLEFLFCVDPDGPPPEPISKAPPSKFSLRDYQQEAHDNCFKIWQTERGALVRSPTGTGKSITAAKIAETWLSQDENRRVMLLEHQRDLVWQIAEEFADVLGFPPHIEMAEHGKYFQTHVDGTPLVTIACRPTFASKEVNGQEVSRLQKFDQHTYDWLLILDEAHYYSRKLKTVANVLRWLESSPTNRILGITATPMRSDNASLKSILPGIASDYRMFDINGGPSAVEDGWIVPYDQRFICVESVDFHGLDEVAGDYTDEQLQQLLGEREQLARLIEPTLQIVGNRQTLIFSAGVQMAKDVAAYINGKAGAVIAEPLDGSTPTGVRKDTYRRFEDSQFQFLSVCGLCREGWNCPSVAAVAVFRPTKSRSLAEQMKGRGCRPLRGVLNGAKTAEERKKAIAASAKPNCIAAGTPILTDMGVVPIELVTTSMKVWDGIEFVSHDGVISQGVRDVITYAGLTATPDHEVFIYDKENPKAENQARSTFGDCASKQASIRVTGVGGKAIREADGRFRRGSAAQREAANNRPVRLRRSRDKGLYRANYHGGWVQEVRQQNRPASLATAPMLSRQGSMCQPKKSSIRQVRWEGDSVSIFDHQGDGVLDCGEPGNRQVTRYRQDRQRPALRTREYQDGHKGHQRQQQERREDYGRSPCVPATTPEYQVLASSSNADVKEWVDVAGDCGPPFQEERGARADRTVHGKAEVFDIINAGPRHRFTAAGLLVSNCIIVDLVGITGLGDCASTAELFGQGIDKEVIRRVNSRVTKKSYLEPTNLVEEIKKTIAQIKEEREEQKRQRLESARRRQEEAERRAKLKADVKFREKRVGAGDVGYSGASPQKVYTKMPFGRFAGREINRLPRIYLKELLNLRGKRAVKGQLRHALEVEYGRRLAEPPPERVSRPEHQAVPQASKTETIPDEVRSQNPGSFSDIFAALRKG